MIPLRGSLRCTMALFLAFTALPLHAGTYRWTPFGPGGGPVSSLVAAPGALYAAASLDVYKSTDGGATWHWSGRGLPFGETLLISDPAEPETLYALTSGVLSRSTNGGRSWLRISSRLFPGASGLAVVPGAPSTLFIATPQAVFRSRNGGARWQQVFHTQGRITALRAVPAEPGTLYLSSDGLEGGARKSVDHGETWGSIWRGAVETLAIAPSDPAHVYVARGHYLWASLDGAVTWGPRRRAPTGSAVFVVAPDAPDTIHAGSSEGLSVSRDGGLTWRRSETGFPKPGHTLPYPRCLAFDPEVPGKIYAGTNWSGVTVSLDDGRTWRTGLQRGLTAQQARELRFTHGDPQTVYLIADMTLTQIFRTTNGGWTWSRFGTKLGSMYEVALDPAHPEDVYIRGYAGAEDVLFHSRDRGKTWQRIGPAPIGSIVVAGPSLLAAGSGISRSTDGGRTWTQALAPTHDIPDCTQEPCRVLNSIIEVIQHPEEPAYLYARGAWVETGFQSVPMIYRSHDGGATWELLVSGANLLAVARSAPGTLYLLRNGEFQKSSDHGATWSSVGFLDPALMILDLAVDPFDAQTLYMATDTGALRSTDGGANWFSLNPGIAQRPWRYLMKIEPHPELPGRVYTFPALGGVLEIQR